MPPLSQVHGPVPHPPFLRRRTRPRRWSAAIGLFALASAPLLAIAGDATPLRSVQEYYDARAQSPGTARTYAWDLTVLYSDPAWGLLWVENDGIGTFLSTSRDFPHFRPGDRFHAEGTIVTGEEITLEGARIRPLPDPAPVVPLEADGDLPNRSRFENRLVAFDAVVDHQSEVDASHLLLEASAEGYHVVIRIQVEPGTPRPALEGHLVRATGVYVSHRDSTGQLGGLALWCRSLDDITVKCSLAQDEAFNSPVVRIEQVTPRPDGAFVHVVGTVHSFDNTTGSITLRDATGQIDVSTAQTRNIRIGTALEAVGVPEIAGLNRNLRNARVRLIRELGTPAPLSLDATSPLRLADQILALEPEAASRAHPVQLFGVATWVAADRKSLYVQDVSGGIEVSCVALPQHPPPLPFTVHIAGRTARGAFAPIVEAATLDWVDPLGSPKARATTLDEMLGGYLHGRWVSTHAYLRAIHRTADELRLDLTTTSGEFHALLPAAADIQAQPGAIISLRGVCSVVANSLRQPTGIRLLVPGAQHIDVELAPPTDPFALPVRTLAGLRAFGPSDATLRRVCTRGVVLFHEVGRYLCLQDGTDTLQVLSRDATPLQPGDRVEVVGLPGSEGSRLVLREATYRRTGAGDEPQPAELDRQGPDTTFDGRLVRVQGVIAALQHQHRASTITLQTSRRRVVAQVPGEHLEQDLCPIGATVALTGVYRVVYDEYRQPIDFGLQLRTPADIVVRHPPPLLTIGRVIWLAGGLLAITAGVLAWLAVLRTRVAQQTALIRTQLEHQAKLEAELQKAQRIESLGFMAGGIAHDFNNLLSGILGNISLARMSPSRGEFLMPLLADAELAALRARDLTQRLLIFTQGGSPSRTLVSIADLVRESVALALHGFDKIGVELKLPEELWAANVDRVQIGQVIQNLVINAAQAMPHGGALSLSAANDRVGPGAPPDLQPGAYLRLRIADTGTGIPPEVLPKIFDPYFTTKKSGTGLGLATVFSIVRRHGGHIEVESHPGLGTTFRVWLPAVEGARPEAGITTPVPRFTAPPPAETIRVLVLEADRTVRRMATAALHSAGYEVTAVTSGREAAALVRAASAGGDRYRVALLDLTVPGDLGAFEIQADLRAVDPAVRLVLSTGRTDDPVFLHYRDHGFTAALAKPYEAASLIQLMTEIVAATGKATQQNQT